MSADGKKSTMPPCYNLGLPKNEVLPAPRFYGNIVYCKEEGMRYNNHPRKEGFPPIQSMIDLDAMLARIDKEHHESLGESVSLLDAWKRGDCGTPAEGNTYGKVDRLDIPTVAEMMKPIPMPDLQTEWEGDREYFDFQSGARIGWDKSIINDGTPKFEPPDDLPLRLAVVRRPINQRQSLYTFRFRKDVNSAELCR